MMQVIDSSGETNNTHLVKLVKLDLLSFFKLIFNAKNFGKCCLNYIRYLIDD